VCEEVMAVKGNWGNYAMLVYVAFVVERRAYQAVAVTTYNLVRCYRRLTFLNLSSLVNCNDLGVGINYIQTILCLRSTVDKEGVSTCELRVSGELTNLHFGYVMLTNKIYFSDECFNSFPHVFYMFRISYVHHQEDKRN